MHGKPKYALTIWGTAQMTRETTSKMADNTTHCHFATTTDKQRRGNGSLSALGNNDTLTQTAGHSNGWLLRIRAQVDENKIKSKCIKGGRMSTLDAIRGTWQLLTPDSSPKILWGSAQKIREKASTMLDNATHCHVESTTDKLKHGNGSPCLGGRWYDTLTQTTDTTAVGDFVCSNRLIDNTHRQGGTSTQRKRKFKNPNRSMWQLLTLDSSSNWSMGQAHISGGNV